MFLIEGIRIGTWKVRRLNWALNVLSEMETLFEVLSLTQEGSLTKKSGHFEGSSQFHCCWRISILIKHSSFLRVKNVRSVSKIMEISRSRKSTLHIASHAAVFRGARISSLPTNACSTENNIIFSLFYLRGKWPINSFEIKWNKVLTR